MTMLSLMISTTIVPLSRRHQLQKSFSRCRSWFRLAIIIAVALIVSGCESIELNNSATKVDEVIIPELRGSVLIDGQPAAGLKLRVSHLEGENSVCEKVTAELAINADGGFAFPAVTGNLGASVLDSINNNWQLCVSTPVVSESANSAETADSDWKLIWYDSHAGVMFGEKFTELACDLTKLPSSDTKKRSKQSFFSRFREADPVCVIADQS